MKEKLQSIVKINVPKLIRKDIDFDFEKMFQFGLDAFKDYNLNTVEGEKITTLEDLKVYLLDDFLENHAAYLTILQLPTDEDVLELWEDYAVFDTIEDKYEAFLTERLKRIKFSVQITIE